MFEPPCSRSREDRESKKDCGFAQPLVGGHDLGFSGALGGGEVKTIVGPEEDRWVVTETGIQYGEELRFQFWRDSLLDKPPHSDQTTE